MEFRSRGICLGRLLPLIMSAVDKLDVADVLAVCTAVVTVFTIDPLCQRISGAEFRIRKLNFTEMFD
jgi:hypothetical protein